MTKKRSNESCAQPSKKKKLSPYTVVDLFCGAGGLSLGFAKTGFDVVLGVDNNKDALATFSKNFGDKTSSLLFNIGALDKKKLYTTIGSDDRELDVLVAGCPCQGFSKQNKYRDHEKEDDRNNLIISTAIIISKVKPKVFVLENVPDLKGDRGVIYMQEFNKILEGRYKIHTWEALAVQYGVPQNRKRFIMVGVRSDIQKEYVLPKPTHKDPANYKTVRDSISDLPEPLDDFSDHPDFHNHQKPRLSDLNTERLRHIPPGGSWRDLPDELKHDCHKKMNGKKSGCWGDVMGRLDWEKPSQTITGGCLSPTKGRYVHPSQDRGLTFRECARLQSFPDDFVFVGTRDQISKQIGNAVPPLLSEHIALSIKNLLDSL